MVARQLRRGTDVERIFSQYDMDGSGTIVRADFVQVHTHTDYKLVSFACGKSADDCVPLTLKGAVADTRQALHLSVSARCE